MASVSDFLMGTPARTETFKFDTLSDEQKGLLNKTIGDMMAGGGTAPNVAPTTAKDTYTKYTGDMTAPLSNLQNLSLSAIEAMTLNEATGGAGSTRAAALEMDKLLKQGGNPVDFSKVYEDSIQAPMLHDFQTKILPMLQANFAGASAFGSDKIARERNLTGDLTRNLTSSKSELLYKTQTDAIERMLKAAGLQGQLGAQSSDLLKTGLAAGDVPRQAEQQKLTAMLNEFLRGQSSAQGVADKQFQADTQGAQLQAQLEAQFGKDKATALMQALNVKTVDNNVAVIPGTKGFVGGTAETLAAMLAKGGMGSLFDSKGVGGIGSNVLSGGPNDIGGGVSGAIRRLFGGNSFSNIAGQGMNLGGGLSIDASGNIVGGTVNPAGYGSLSDLDAGIDPVLFEKLARGEISMSDYGALVDGGGEVSNFFPSGSSDTIWGVNSRLAGGGGEGFFSGVGAGAEAGIGSSIGLSQVAGPAMFIASSILHDLTDAGGKQRDAEQAAYNKRTGRDFKKDWEKGAGEFAPGGPRREFWEVVTRPATVF